ncbi:MAG: ankyrin repeat domain-containing protein [Acidobacteriota bacterium]
MNDDDSRTDGGARHSGLPVVGSSPGANLSADDAAFLEAPREVSSREFLRAMLGDERETVARMIVEDDRVLRSRDVAGASAIQLAVYHGLDEMLGILLRAEQPLDLWEAAAVGDGEQVALALADDGDRLARTSGDGFPALALAAWFGREEVVDLLLARGADPRQTAENPTLVQPLHSALGHRDLAVGERIARRLLAAGADVEAVQAGGFRPLHTAAARGSAALVQLLLESGAQADVETDLGLRPQDFAEERGHLAVLALLG